ncbi:MAG: hypothetical protein ACOZNI_33465 [Myxococcota bacterium]
MDVRRVALFLVLADSLLFAAIARRWVALERTWQVFDLRVAAQEAMEARVETLSRSGELE